MDKNRNTNDLVRPGLCTSDKKDLPTIRRELRQKAPALSYKDLRRARESYYSSKIQDLYEEGYAMVAEFMEETERMESELHAKAPEGLHLKHLYDAPEMLNGLIKALKIVEELDHIGMSSDVVLNLLRLGNEFANGIDDFKWIAEKVISKALSVSEKIRLDDGRTKATVLCSMGKLYAQNKFYENANQQFEMALDICSGRDWTVSKTDQTLLSRVICLEYCSSLDHYAQNLLRRHSDHNRAKLICDMAIKMGKLSGSFTILADAYASYGRVLSLMELFEQALEMFEHCVSECRSSGDLGRVAVAELNTADCLYSLKKYEGCLRHAKRANKIAISNNFLEEEARSLELMAHAEHSFGNNVVATEEYSKASDIYQELGHINEMLNTRCFAAISKARDYIEPYIEVVLKSDNEKFGENKYMAKLLDWELRREPFWDSVIDGKPVVSLTDTTFLAPEDAFKVPTVAFRTSSTDSLANPRESERRNSVFLGSISAEQIIRSKSLH